MLLSGASLSRRRLRAAAFVLMSSSPVSLSFPSSSPAAAEAASLASSPAFWSSMIFPCLAKAPAVSIFPLSTSAVVNFLSAMLFFSLLLFIFGSLVNLLLWGWHVLNVSLSPDLISSSSSTKQSASLASAPSTSPDVSLSVSQ